MLFCSLTLVLSSPDAAYMDLMESMDFIDRRFSRCRFHNTVDVFIKSIYSIYSSSLLISMGYGYRSLTQKKIVAGYMDYME